MTVYTFSEARQNFASLLDRAKLEGSVRVKRRDGQVFLIQPEKLRRSPLDVEGIDVDVSADEIVGIVREMRQRVGGARPANKRSEPTGGKTARHKAS